MSEYNPRIAVVQMHSIPGDVSTNLARMTYYIGRARANGAHLVVFPELATSGYLLGDRWEHDAFIKEIEKANEKVREASEGLVVVWGSVKADWDKIGEDGRTRKYNAAFVARDGSWAHTHNDVLVGWMPKTNLPKYRIFDDARHFYPAAKLAAEMGMPLGKLLQPFNVLVPGANQVLMLAVSVCEDLWEDEYNTKPSQMYGNQQIDLLVDISHSPWTQEKWHARDQMLQKRAKDAHCPILYVNSVGLQNNAKNLVWFDGNSTLVGIHGEFRWRAPQHDSDIYLVNLATAVGPVREHLRGVEEIHSALVPAMREFFSPFSRVVVGLSGGIDSAVMTALLVEALSSTPGDRVLALNMPTQFNSQTTQHLAARCAKALGIKYRVVPIQALYEEQLRTLLNAQYPNPPMLVKENIQARIRGSVLAMVAACEGGVFTCNGNKTEVALNYFTLYGDGAGAAAFLGDIWKGQVYKLAHFINARHGRQIIPQGIIDIVPSAELSPEQSVDEGKGDPIFYPYHDELLRAFIEKRWDPTTVMQHLLQGTLVRELRMPQDVLHRFFASKEALVQNLEWCWREYNKEFKRHQLPPVFITSRRAFGFDRRDTIAGEYFTGEYERLKEVYLKCAA